MKDKESFINNKKENYVQEHIRIKTWHKIVTGLAAVVIFCTVYVLIMPAATQQSETYCGQQEHIHDENCYTIQDVLICEKQEDENHIHDENCYQQESVLTCDMPVHEHALQCFSNPDADIEDETVWEKMFTDINSDNKIDNLIEIAKSQLGYEESIRNYQVMADGITTKGYSRYGAYNDDPYGDWNAYFISYCLNYAEIDNSFINKDINKTLEALNEKELLLKINENNPNVGDLLFLKDNDDYIRLGIIVEIDDNKVKFVEGDIDNKVSLTEYDLQDENILGFVCLNEPLDIEINEEEVLTVEEENIEIEPIEQQDEEVKDIVEEETVSTEKIVEEEIQEVVEEETVTVEEEIDPEELIKAFDEKVSQPQRLMMAPLGLAPLGATPNGGGTPMAAKPYDSEYSTSGTYALPSGASTNVSNSWQVVSGDYKAGKAGDGTYTYSNDNAVRTQKLVIPTGNENKFQVYLNIEPQMSWQEFLNSLDNYQTHNNSSSFNPSSGCSQLLTPDQYDALSSTDKAKYTAFTVDYVDKTVNPYKHYPVTRYGNFTGEGKNAIQAVKNGSYCFSSEKFSHNGLVRGIDWPSFIAHPENGLEVDISELKREFTFSDDVTYPHQVSDPMGAHIIYEDNITYDGGSVEEPSNSNNNTLTWTVPTVNYPTPPYYSTHTETGHPISGNSYEGEITYIDNVVPVTINGKQTLFYTGVLQCRYNISLDVTDEGFVSCGSKTETPAAGSICPTNGTTPLTYYVGDKITANLKTTNFTVPQVKGLLYNLNVIKTNEDGTTNLAGGGFDLYAAAEETDTDAVLIPGTSNRYGIKIKHDYTRSDGKTPNMGIAVGQLYYLVEAYAPTGYEIAGKPIGFTLVDDATGTGKHIELETSAAFTDLASVGNKNDTTGVYEIKLKDNPHTYTPPTQPDDPDRPDFDSGATLNKQIDYLGDNTGATDADKDLYRLNLSLSSTQQPIDLLLVIDQSLSMTYDMDGNPIQAGSSTISRQDILLDFLNGENNSGNGFIKSFTDMNEDNNLAILTFSADCDPSSSTRYVRRWGSSGNTVNLVTPIGGTNYTAGLYGANVVLNDSTIANDGNLKMMIFLGDGAVTLGYKDGRLQNGLHTGNVMGGADVTDNGDNILEYIYWYSRNNLAALNFPDRYPVIDSYFGIPAREDDFGNSAYFSTLNVGYPKMRDLLTAQMNFDWINSYPYGEIDESLLRAFIRYDGELVSLRDSGTYDQQMQFVTNHVTYLGDEYDLFWTTEESFNEFADNNPDVVVYSIGYSNDLTGTVNNREFSEVLKHFSGKNSDGKYDRYFQCSDADTLSNAIYTAVSLGDIKMNDTLSTYVDLPTDTNMEIKIKLANATDYSMLYENGAFTTLGNEMLVTAADPNNPSADYTHLDTTTGKISVVFKPDVRFMENFECVASFTIKPNMTAYNTYATNGYNATGDSNTDVTGNDTSSNKDGFYSNATAGASWSKGGKDKDDDFPKPVVQVHPVTLTITKEVANKTTSDKFDFKATINTDAFVKPATGANYTLSNNDTQANFSIGHGESVTLTFPIGKTITIEETPADGYTQVFKKNQVTLSNTNTCQLTIGADDAITVVNMPGYELPKTGGIGTNIFYIVGGIMTLISLIALSKKNILRKLSVLLVIVASTMLLLPSPKVYAYSPLSPTTDVDFTITAVDGSTNVSNMNFDIYKVADVDEYFNLTLADDFKPYLTVVTGLDDFTSLDQNGWSALANNLKPYVINDNLTPIVSGNTDTSGQLSLTLKPALYLVLGKSCQVNDYIYDATPFMVFLPGEDEITGGWNYTVKAKVKLSKSSTLIDRQVLKAWDDEGFESLRPTQISVKLLCDGNVYDSQILNAANNWKYTWKDLNKVDVNTGKVHEYLIVEDVPNNYTVSTNLQGITFTLTNKFNRPTEDDPPVYKIIKGDTPPTAAEFTFLMQADDPSYPMPEGSTGSQKQITIKGAGVEEFGVITFVKEGTYTYTISEINNNLSNYTYDNRIFKITYVISKDSKGDLIKKKTITDISGNTVDRIQFENSYKKPNNIIPYTGMLWWPVPVLMSAGMGMIILGYMVKKNG